MPTEQANASVGAGEVLSTAQLIEHLSRFDGPPEQFLSSLLAVQCHLASASAGAILRTGPGGKTEVLAVHPPLERDSTAPVWLAQAAEVAGGTVMAGKTLIQPIHEGTELYGQPVRRHLVLVPLAGGRGVRGVEAFLSETADSTELAASRERLELSASLLSLYEMRLTLQRRGLDLRRLQVAMETLSAVNEADRFAAAAMAMCNEVGSRWQCERVNLGFLAGRYVKLKAMSHTEKFSRKMKLVQHIESVMEECLDQDLEVLYPNSPEVTYVSRAAAEMSRRHGPAAIASLPLRRGGEPVAVLTVERPADRPFDLEEMEALRLTCDLCTSRLADLHDHDRWFGARAAAAVRKGAATLVGLEHTWVKVAVIAVFLALGLLIFGQGDYQADAQFVLEATERQVVPAPFAGYLESVAVEPPDRVEAGKTVLAVLDTAELKLQLAAARAEQLRYLKQAATAMRDGETAQAQVAQADADQVAAKIRLLDYRIGKAKVVSAIDGVVVTGDLKRQIGAPVKAGEILFEVAPLEKLRANLSVPEDQIAEVEVGSEGELATASFPNRRIPFVVERINPVAEVVEKQNVFKVRARLDAASPWMGRMRPGMEGVAKVKLGRRSYGWLLTRRLINWIRMKLWL